MSSSLSIDPETCCFLDKPVHIATVRFEIASKGTTSDFMIPQQRGKNHVGFHSLGSLLAIRRPTLRAGSKMVQPISSSTERA